MDEGATSSPTGAVRTTSLRMAAVAIVVATILAYLPAMRGGFLWDDNAHVTKPALQSAHGLYRIWFDVGATQQYYPLLHSFFWLQHRLWGDWPVGYHAVNLALHIGVVLLVMTLARRLLAEKGFKWADEAALLAGAIFALHPVHVESVAWITEQKNTLSAAFYLLSMLAYFRFDLTRQPRAYFAALALFAAALLSKPVTVTLPAALLVILWWLRGSLSIRRDVAPLLPWFALSVASGMFAAWVEHDVIGAEGEAFHLARWDRVLLPGRVVWFYAAKLVWPRELTFVYPRWTLDAANWRQWLYPAGLILVIIILAAWARRSRGPLAATLFFAGTLFPVLGFFNVYLFLYTFVADHFQYLASLGLILLAACAVVAAIGRRTTVSTGLGLLAILPAMLGVMTHRQCRMYADIQTLYETTLARNPSCWMAYNNLGVVLKDKGRPQDAIERYHQALALRPAYPEAHNNLGVALNSVGRRDEALASLQEAVRLLPQYADAWANLISTLVDAGRLLAAIDRGEEAVKRCPADARIRVNYGIALSMAKRNVQATEQLEEAIRLQPDLIEAHANLAVGYEALGRRDEALAAARRACALARASGQGAIAEQLEAWMQSRGAVP